MICEKCNKKLAYVRDVIGDPFMYCPECRQVWVCDDTPYYTLRKKK